MCDMVYDPYRWGHRACCISKAVVQQGLSRVVAVVGGPSTVSDVTCCMLLSACSLRTRLARRGSRSPPGISALMKTGM